MRWKRFTVEFLVWFTVVVCAGGAVFVLVYNARHPIDAEQNTSRYREQATQPVLNTQQANAEPHGQYAQCGDSWACKASEPITLLTALLIIGIIVTNCIYWGQLKKMRETVALVAQQSETMKEQSNAAKWQAEVATGQLVAMQSQERAAHATVEETKKIVAAAEDSAKAARKAIEVTEASEAPYFGIIGVRPDDFKAGDCPGVAITFFNGGKTPAWHFFPTAHFIVGEHPKYGTKHPLEMVTPEIAATFFSATGSHNFEFRQAKFVLTERILQEKDGLFLVVLAEYFGRSRTLLKQTFTCVWEGGKFCDWIADAIDWELGGNKENDGS